MPLTQPLILVTDLDGTLLDHHDYRFDAARPALALLKQFAIPLIFNSSKTAAEIIAIRQEMDNCDPFVVENGSCIYYPAGHDEGRENYRKVHFGTNRRSILNVLKQLREEFGLPFTGFDDMSVEEVMNCTGLSQEQALLAKQRECTEPLLWQGNAEQWVFFCAELQQAGLSVAKGGRFVSVSANTDKGRTLHWLREYYRVRFSAAPILIALGDSENDRQILESADYAVLVRSPAHGLPKISAKQLTVTSAMGPQGWNQSVIELLTVFKLI